MMQIVKKTNDYIIIKKRSGRFGVRNKHNVWINGNEKSAILIKEGLVKAVEAQTEESQSKGDSTDDSTSKSEKDNSTQAAQA